MRRVLIAIAATLSIALAHAQGPNFPSQSFTGAQTGPTIYLANPYAIGAFQLAATSITTVTFQVQGTSDGVNFNALPCWAVGTPATILTSITATSTGMYDCLLPGITAVRVVTTGTFTATGATFQLTASPLSARASPAAAVSTTYPTGVLYGNNSTSAPTAATGSQLLAAMGPQTANTFDAAPNGAAGTPSFRTIVSADINAALTTPGPIGSGTPNTVRATLYSGVEFTQTSTTTAIPVTGTSVQITLAGAYSPTIAAGATDQQLIVDIYQGTTAYTVTWPANMDSYTVGSSANTHSSATYHYSSAKSKWLFSGFPSTNVAN